MSSVHAVACVVAPLVALLTADVPLAAPSAASVAPAPCTGALPLYARLGTVSDLRGSHRREEDVEARLSILRDVPPARAVRVGFAYVDAEGDTWIAVGTDARARSDWRHVAPTLATQSPAYALIERVGMPKGYRFSACA